MNVLAVTTTRAHVNIALYLMDKINTTYLGIGKPTEWDDDENPPVPNESINKLTETIGYKKIQKMSLCKHVENEESTEYPTVTYMGQVWALIPRELAYDEEATHVFFETRIQGGDFPPGPYRQVGIFTGLKPEDENNRNKPVLLPHEVKDRGTLEFYDNRPHQNRTADTTLIERFIVSTKLD